MRNDDTGAVASLLTKLALALPSAAPADLESRLMAFDQVLEFASPDLRPFTAKLLAEAALKTPAPIRELIEAASARIASAVHSTTYSEHRAATAAYTARFPEPKKPPPPAGPDPKLERKVTWEEFAVAMKEAGAVVDPSFRSAGIGEHTDYRDPAGQLVGLIVVRYWRGEEDFDYFIAR